MLRPLAAMDGRYSLAPLPPTVVPLVRRSLALHILHSWARESLLGGAYPLLPLEAAYIVSNQAANQATIDRACRISGQRGLSWGVLSCSTAAQSALVFGTGFRDQGLIANSWIF
jgi:hypothetical protein